MLKKQVLVVVVMPVQVVAKASFCVNDQAVESQLKLSC